MLHAPVPLPGAGRSDGTGYHVLVRRVGYLDNVAGHTSGIVIEPLAAAVYGRSLPPSFAQRDDMLAYVENVAWEDYQKLQAGMRPSDLFLGLEALRSRLQELLGA